MTEDRNRYDEMVEEKMRKEFQEKIEIPQNVEDSMQDAYRQIYQGVVRMKPVKQRSIPKWAKAAAAVACVVFAGSVVLVSNPAIAKDLPLIGNIFDRLMEARDAQPYGYKDTTAYDNIKENAEVVQQEASIVSDSGLEISVSDVYCDGYDFYFTLAIRDEEGVLGDANTVSVGKLYEEAEGKRQVTVSAGENGENQVTETGEEALENRVLPVDVNIDGVVTGCNMNVKKVEQGIYVGLLNIEKYQLPEKVFADRFHVEMGIDAVQSVYPGDTSKVPTTVMGEWNLVFDVAKDESANEIFNVQAAGNEFAVEKVVRTPSNLHIDLVIPQQWVEKNPDIRVLDENGTAVQKIDAVDVEREDGSQLREYRLQYSKSGSYTIQVIDKNNPEEGYPMIDEIHVSL